MCVCVVRVCVCVCVWVCVCVCTRERESVCECACVCMCAREIVHLATKMCWANKMELLNKIFTELSWSWSKHASKRPRYAEVAYSKQFRDAKEFKTLELVQKTRVPKFASNGKYSIMFLNYFSHFFFFSAIFKFSHSMRLFTKWVLNPRYMEGRKLFIVYVHV